MPPRATFAQRPPTTMSARSVRVVWQCSVVFQRRSSRLSFCLTVGVKVWQWVVV